MKRNNIKRFIARVLLGITLITSMDLTGIINYTAKDVEAAIDDGHQFKSTGKISLGSDKLSSALSTSGDLNSIIYNLSGINVSEYGYDSSWNRVACKQGYGWVANKSSKNIAAGYSRVDIFYSQDTNQLIKTSYALLYKADETLWDIITDTIDFFNLFNTPRAGESTSYFQIDIIEDTSKLNLGMGFGAVTEYGVTVNGDVEGYNNANSDPSKGEVTFNKIDINNKDLYKIVYTNGNGITSNGDATDKMLANYFDAQITQKATELDIGNEFEFTSNLESGTTTIASGTVAGDAGNSTSEIANDIWNNSDKSMASGDTNVDAKSIGFARAIINALYYDVDLSSPDDPTKRDSEGNIVVDVWDNYHRVMAVLSDSIYQCTQGQNPHAGKSSVTLVSKTGDTKDISIEGDGTIGYRIDSSVISSLKPYQKDSLAYIYTQLMNVHNIKIDKTSKNNCVFTNMLVKDKIQDEELKSVASFKLGEGASGTMDGNIVDKEELETIIKEYEDLGFIPSESDQILNIARLGDTLSAYTMYHSSADNLADGISENTSTYNSDLQHMLSSWGIFSGEFDTKDEDINFAFTGMPGTVKKLENGYQDLIDDSINTTGQGYDAIQMIFYAIGYSFYTIENANDTKYAYWKCSYLEEALSDGKLKDPNNNLAANIKWLTDCYGMDQYNFEQLKQVYIQDEVSIWVFRCIIELAKTIERFGIDPNSWSTEVRDYYNLYTSHRDVFDALEQNSCIYGQGYSGDVNLRNPLGKFYSVQSNETSVNWNLGYALSALYVPMQTNLYDISTYDFIAGQNPEWLADFMYRYGFYRKALYISTDPNIVVNNELHRTSDNGRVLCTLADLVNYDRDIELYIDTGFYNADQIAEAIGKVDYATLYQYTHQQQQKTNVTDTAGQEQLTTEQGTDTFTSNNKNFIDETLNLDTNTLLKDNDITVYSIDIAKDVTQLGDTPDTKTKSLYDGYILSADAITGQDGVFGLLDYSPMTSYGVVSAIYRDIDLYNMLASVPTDGCTVFKSSKNILYVDGADSSDWLSYMNYLQLSNLKAQMNLNVETQLDMDNPVFIDIFGNIVTESGFVIIPAASNPTLCQTGTSDNCWNPYTVGFGSYCKNSGYDLDTANLPQGALAWLCSNITENIEETDADTITTSGGWFVQTREGRIQLKNTRLVSHGLIATINWATLNSHSDIIQEVFWNNAFYSKARKMYSIRICNMITEVLRGAPVEFIDYEKEGLTQVSDSSVGIVIAYALDKLMNSVISKSKDYVNSLVTMPNVAFMPYLKYVVYFGIKITLALFVVIFIFRLFINGVKNKFGIKASLSYIFTVVIVVSAVWILPNSVIWSYDQANSMLLSTEATDIALYDTLRRLEGQEIGITNVQQIDEDTELLVHIDTVRLNWLDILSKGILTNEYSSFTDLFDDAIKDTPYTNMPGIIHKGSKVYINVDSILDSTRVSYNRNTNRITNKVQVDTVSKVPVIGENGEADFSNQATYYSIYSYSSPYYVILDQLIANVNEYNESHDIQTFQSSVDSKGTVITYDVCAPYLMSDEFLVDGYDILGLTDALMLEYTLPKYTYIFGEDAKARMSRSSWYPDEELDEDTKQARVKEIYAYARSYVVDHKDVIRHMPDQQFLKVLAFACATKYNQVFHNPYANSIKLITVDNRDLIRFMTSDFKGIYENYAYTFGRSVFNTSGTVGVILAAVLSIVIMLTSVLKPILIIALFVIILINIMFRHILLDKPNQGVEGYFIGCALFMILNFFYAGLLKFCFFIANTDVTPIASMIICIVIQILYLLGLLVLIWTQVSDWENGGFLKYMTAFGGVLAGFASNHSYNPQRDSDIPRSRYNGYNNYDAYSQYNTIDMRLHRDNEPQGVYLEEKPNKRRNRQSYDGERTLQEMYERDEERENSPYNR